MTTSPIIPFPKDVRRAELVFARERTQLWRAFLGDRAIALRLACFPASDGPIVDPAEALVDFGRLAARLEISATAQLISSGASGEGFFAAEEWIDGAELGASVLSWGDACRVLASVARDLLTLHSARKWHGGVRPSRIKISGARAMLHSFAWSIMTSTLTRDQIVLLDDRARRRDKDCAPELVLHGARAAGPANDVYGFARAFSVAIGGVRAARVPAEAARALNAAMSIEPANRPSLRELVPLLSA